ncbi:MAG: adenylosuccinate lyase family protein [Actinomycetota bacterium]|nr:adenylosuccinate lyase family protein [Actinomycetota bacterium]
MTAAEGTRRLGDGCTHERGSIVDSRFHGDRYATPASRRIFCDVCRVQRWLDVEAALAQSQASVGLIPAEAADAISAAACVEGVDLVGLREGIRQTGHSLVAILTALQQACEGEAGEYVHYGATTQDIQDTAQALEMAEVMGEIDRHVEDILVRLVDLAREHRDSLMVGRTHAQPALPTTFGHKVAGWMDELLRQAERLQASRPRVLVAQLFGGVGTMAGFGGVGPELLERFAGRLSLGVPVMPWHVARDRVAEYLTILAMLTATLGRIADEVRTLSRPEFDELEEGWEYGLVGSSTMPHKRNPEDCEQVVVLARLARANAALGMEGMVQEHERDSRGLRLEWVAVADTSHHTLAALALLSQMLNSLKVHDDRMAEHAHAAAEVICSEALMLALAPHVGKQSAHALVYDLSQQAQSQKRPLREVLDDSAEVTASLEPGQIEAAFDPLRHLGSAGTMVDRTIALAEAWVGDRRPGTRRHQVRAQVRGPARGDAHAT